MVDVNEMEKERKKEEKKKKEQEEKETLIFSIYINSTAKKKRDAKPVLVTTDAYIKKYNASFVLIFFNYFIFWKY